jgi:ribosomal protein S18 acetylase RimI-like enzyme
MIGQSSRNFRIRELAPPDMPALRSLLEHVGIFEAAEIAVAEELLDAAVAGSRDYLVHVADTAPAGGAVGHVVGYVCHGHDPMTDALYDLYWIVVHPDARGRGIGRALLTHAEECVRLAHGRGIVIETSGLPRYEPARRLYETCGYSKAAEVADFYKPGDAKLIYRKTLVNTV